MLLVLTALLLSTTGDGPSAHANAAMLAKTYDLTPALPWRAELDAHEALLPYFTNNEPRSELNRDPLYGADSVIQGLRTITGKEFEYEGRELFVDESGRLLVKAPPAVHELAERYLAFLEGAFGAPSELSIDVFTLPESAKDVAVQGLVPVSDVAKFAAAAEQGGSRHTYRLQLRAGVVARLDTTHTTTLVADYDIEIAQASAIADPIVEQAAPGTRLLASAAPGPGGTWLALIVRRGEQVGDVEMHDLPFEFMINNQDRPSFVPAPHVYQSLDLENRSLALNTFIPDGKALVVRTSHECKNPRPTDLVVVRPTGKPMASSQRFQAAAKGAAKSEDILLLDARVAAPPRCAIDGRIQLDDGSPIVKSMYRANPPQLLASIRGAITDPVIRMIEPLDAWDHVDSIGAWIFLARDPNRAIADASAPAPEDPMATLARCAPPPRVVQLSIVLKRNAASSASGGSPVPPANAAPVASSGETLVHVMLPVRTGAVSSAVVSRENSEVVDYNVEVAQSAGGADPWVARTFDGLALLLRPDVASSGEITLDAEVCAHVKRGETREFDPRVPTIGRVQQSTYDQLSTREKLVFPRADGGPRRVILGDAAGGPGSLTLEIEIVP